MGLGTPNTVEIQHGRYLVEHLAQLVLKVHVVADDAQVGVARPCAQHLAVELTRHLHVLAAELVVLVGVELFGTGGSGHHVQDGLVAGIAQLHGVGAHLLGQCFPDLGRDIGADVHRAAVAHDEHGLAALGRHLGEVVLKCQLDVQCRFLGLKEQGLVLGQIVDTGAAEHRGHLGDGEHLEAQAAEVLDNPGHRRRLASAGATGQHNLSDFIGDLISHLVNDNSGFTKRKPKIHTILDPHNLFLLKDVKTHAKPPACYCQEQIPQRHQKTMFFFPSSSVLLARHAQRIRSSGCKHYSYEPLRQCEADKHSRDGYHRGRETNNDLQNNYSKVNCCSDSP